jgi:hypothetical protein
MVIEIVAPPYRSVNTALIRLEKRPEGELSNQREPTASPSPGQEDCTIGNRIYIIML